MFQKLGIIKWYVAFVLICLAFFTYSQTVGWRWVGSTGTTSPEEQQPGSRTNTYRYSHHK